MDVEKRDRSPNQLLLDVLVEALDPAQRFRRGLVFKAHRLLYYSTLSLRVIKKKKDPAQFDDSRCQIPGAKPSGSEPFPPGF